eukprot:CAMPEP_0196573108 /NCGR_PEP_ID=MMETSP1081-20130531/3058_1 /TAXON_ID=36882 /ORGANISM="Pyramimonas amylifera, Strain CCMP720" /LENGTH=378 /DNA_ID=CAMNT_0041890695 /DNA_START=160 /DNA_END=1296 /DNA_ORIENTATION=-
MFKGVEFAGFLVTFVLLLIPTTLTSVVFAGDSSHAVEIKESPQLTKARIADIENFKIEVADLKSKLAKSEKENNELSEVVKEKARVEGELRRAQAQVEHGQQAQQDLQTAVKDLQDKMIKSGEEWSSQRTALLTRAEKLRLKEQELMAQFSQQAGLDAEERVALAARVSLLEQQLQGSGLQAQLHQAWSAAESKLGAVLKSLNVTTNSTQVGEKMKSVSDTILAELKVARELVTNKSSEMMKAAGPRLEATSAATTQNLKKLKESTEKLASSSKDYVDSVFASPNVVSAKRSYSKAIDELVVFTVDALSKLEITKAYANQRNAEMIVKVSVLLPLLLLSTFWFCSGIGKSKTGCLGATELHQRKSNKQGKGKKSNGTK